MVSLVVVACALVAACVGEEPPPNGGASPDGGNVDPNGSQDGGAAGTKALGEGCSAGGECESGFCADGVCCNTACSGQCETCGGASKGTCTLVTGIPIAPRQPCNGAGTSCGGTCDGSSPTCTYVTAGTICGGSCSGTCDGAGTCSDTSAGSCPDGFACGAGGKCLTSCTVKADCQPNFDCDQASNVCKRIAESDCFDGIDNNGDGLADCQDPTCLDSSAICVPAVGAGAVIGTLVNQLPCPAGFGGPTQNLNSSIKSGSCTAGCDCETKCTGDFAVYTGTGCTGSSTTLGSTTGTNGDSSTCKNISNVNFQSIKITNLARNGCQNSGSSTWQAASPAWNTSKVFCSVNRSSLTCGQNQVCVPKVASGIASKVAAGGGCPTGYTGAQATYYTGYTNGSCSCGCTASTDFNCAAIAFAFEDTDTCTGGNELVSANVSSYSSSCNNFGGSVNIKSMRLDWFSLMGDSCTSTANLTAPTPTGGQLLCNAP